MLAHVPLALAVQLFSYILGRAIGADEVSTIWLGCFAACAVCVEREITQHEYRWIERFGHGKRANMPFFAGLQFWQWNRHSKVETLVACAVSLATAWVIAGPAQAVIPKFVW